MEGHVDKRELSTCLRGESSVLWNYVIMPTMKGQIDTVEDDFWTEHIELFTAQFPSYYTKPQKVRGRFHTSEEKYSASAHEIIPISEQQGNRTYVMMQPLCP